MTCLQAAWDEQAACLSAQEASHLIAQSWELLSAESEKARSAAIRHWVHEMHTAGLSLRDSLAFLGSYRRLPVLRHRPSSNLIDALIAEVSVAWVSQEEREWSRLWRERSEALELMNRQLQAVERQRSEFISTLSHELRTPLTAIIGSCELLLEDFGDELPDAPKEYIRLIDHSTALIRRLIDDVLDYAKLEAGELKLHTEVFAPRESIRETLFMLTPLIEKKALQIACDFGDASRDAWADPIRFRQIMINLLSNAIKFSPEGGTIRIEMRDSIETLTISVIDEGPGIAPADQGIVFERFKQVGNAGSPIGTGLGLPIARRLAELHGGTIALESEPGKGAVFTLALPWKA